MMGAWPLARPGRLGLEGTAYNNCRICHPVMCLAVPGRILSIANGTPATPNPPHASPAAGKPLESDPDLWRMAEVDFGGVRQQVSLACLPHARVGDRVLVHVGFALALVEDETLEPSP